MIDVDSQTARLQQSHPTLLYIILPSWENNAAMLDIWSLMHEKGVSQGSVLMALAQMRAVPIKNKVARFARKMMRLLLQTRNGCTNPETSLVWPLVQWRWCSNGIIVMNYVIKHLRVWNSLGLQDSILLEAWNISFRWIFPNRSKWSQYLDPLSSEHDY